MTRDWRSSVRDLSARLAILERRTETPAQRALVSLLWGAAARGDECCCYLGDECPLCEAWRAIGHAGKWPGAVRAGKVLGR